MAGHDDPGGMTDKESDTHDVSRAQNVVGGRFERLNIAIALPTAAMTALIALAAWYGYRLNENRTEQQHRNEFIQAARQGALNLATIDYKSVDAGVQRILDGSTGAFHDDFQRRSGPFIEVIKKAQATSEGTVVAAGLESEHGEQAQILVTMNVKMANQQVPKQDPVVWRMRINVEKSGDTAKMSTVQFVQ